MNDFVHVCLIRIHELVICVGMEGLPLSSGIQDLSCVHVIRILCFFGSCFVLPHFASILYFGVVWSQIGCSKMS